MALVKHSSAYHQTDERQMEKTFSTPPGESVFFKELKPEIYVWRWEREQLRKQVTLIFFVDGL